MSTLKTTAIQHLNGSSPNINLDSNNKVGLGTASPAELLSVTGNIRLQTANSRVIGFNSTAPYVLNYSGGASIFFNTLGDGSQEIGFETHYSGNSHLERMRITKEGFVTKPYHPAFHVSYPNSTTLRQSELIFTGTSGAGRFNTGGYYSTSTGRFTAPVAGRYMFMFTLRADSTNNYFHPKFVVNGSAYENGQMIWGGALDYKSCCSSVIYSLAAGDWVSVRTNESANDTGSLSAQAQCTFSGHLIG